MSAGSWLPVSMSSSLESNAFVYAPVAAYLIYHCHNVLFTVNLVCIAMCTCSYVVLVNKVAEESWGKNWAQYT